MADWGGTEVLPKFDDALAAYHLEDNNPLKMRREDSVIVVSVVSNNSNDDVCQFDAGPYIFAARTTSVEYMHRLMGNMALFGATVLASTCGAVQTRISLATAQGTIGELEVLVAEYAAQNATLKTDLAETRRWSNIQYTLNCTDREDHDAKIAELKNENEAKIAKLQNENEAKIAELEKRLHELVLSHETAKQFADRELQQVDGCHPPTHFPMPVTPMLVRRSQPPEHRLFRSLGDDPLVACVARQASMLASACTFRFADRLGDAWDLFCRLSTFRRRDASSWSQTALN
jgi:hypothetical protein